MKSVALGILCSAAAIAIATPALAAHADYYLVIEGVKGEASVGAKVSNWSFGASNPSSVGGGASGKRESPTKASTGQTSVRESPTRASAGRGGDPVPDIDVLAKADEVDGMSLTLPAGSDAAKLVCGDGKSVERGHIVSSDGRVFNLENILIGSCTTAGGGAGGTVAIQVTGTMRTHELKGHVTLMK